MNRRSFLQRTGLAAIGLWLAGKTTTGTPTTSATTYSHEATKTRSIHDAIMAMDISESPMLTMFGSGKRFRLEEWPNHKVEWLEDVLIPLDKEDRS